jgi:molybdopterin/thiamine biosynthesis adenylyltransferase
LQRQIVHATSRLGMPKVDSAEVALKDLNPDTKIIKYQERLNSENVDRIFGAGWDAIIDGCDNFPTRYLVNDACQFLNKPLVDASIFMFEGQVTVYMPENNSFGYEAGPCYRCLYPDPPPPGEVPSCAEAGVLGVLPGLVGCIQAVEAIKILVGIGEPLIGRLLMIDTLDMSFRTLNLKRDPDCPISGDHPTVTELIDYEQFCGLPPMRNHSHDTAEQELVTA